MREITHCDWLIPVMTSLAWEPIGAKVIKWRQSRGSQSQAVW